VFKALAIILPISVASTAMGQVHQDIYVGLAGGAFTIGGISEDGSVITPGVRVFGADLGESGVPLFADEPGMQSPDGTFAAGTSLRLNVGRAVRQWNGTDFLDMSSAVFTIAFGPASFDTPATDSVVQGFSLVADSEGGLHDHPDYTLSGAGDGIYLLEMFVDSSTGAYDASERYWIVFNNNLDEDDHDLAIEWVNDNLVPTPGVLPLLAGGLLMASRRRR